MKLKFDFQHTGVPEEIAYKTFDMLTPEILRIKNDLKKKDYSSQYASLHLADDTQWLDQCQEIIQEKKRLHPTLLVIIGIGGSNLGTRAIQEALLGTLYNQKKDVLRVYYVDTVDPDYIDTIYQLAVQELEQKKTILVNVITKSGTTTETIANFELFLALLMHYHPDDYSHFIVVTTDRNSPLWTLAEKKQYSLLEIPKKVGGRFSVFSSVGLFPLGLLGCDIRALLQGAADAILSCTSTAAQENVAAQSALTMYHQYNQGIFIQDLFLFGVHYESIGKWYRQLVGESLGKEYDVQGTKVEVGITPTVSIGTIDLHSVGQLYLGGPRDKATTFVHVTPTRTLQVPHFTEFESLVAQIQGTSFSTIMQAILHGVETAFAQDKRPFISIEIPETTAYTLGQFLQFKMLEVLYLGFLLTINPFDQPNVERYKEETRNILQKLQ